jgi:hypothetical protein
MSEHDDLIQLPGIPSDAQPLWAQLVTAELAPVHKLFSEVRAYQTMLAQRSQWSEDEVDPALAQALCGASNKLLGSLNERSPESTRRLVQGAVRYFVLEDDADSDLDSILGLDDDALVMNAVMNKLGHPDWCVELL